MRSRLQNNSIIKPLRGESGGVRDMFHLGALIVKTLILISGVYGIFSFYTSYVDRLRLPSDLRQAVYYATHLKTVEAKEIVKPVQEYPESDYEYYYQLTRLYESHKGMDMHDSTATHVYCQNIGKVNEIGYFLNGDKHFCFENEQDQHDTYIRWLKERVDEGMTLAQSQCYYVTGHKLNSCERSINVGL